MKILSNPIETPFNEWLSKNGVYLAIGVAGLLLLVVAIILFLNYVKKNNKKVIPETKNTADFAAFLGGKANILTASKNGSRIVLTLKDYAAVDEGKLKEAGVLSIIKMSNKITLVLNKGDVESVFNFIN